MTKDLTSIRKELEKLIGRDNVSNNFYKISDYCMNHIAKKILAISKSEPFLVARPRTVKQAATVVKYARSMSLPVFIRGGGTGYSGGEIPTMSGIVLETTGLDQIIEVDSKGRYVTCGAGVSVKDLNSYLQTEHGLWWPHDPGSREWATVGGAISTLGVGAYSTKFGYASDGVTAMKIVTPEGDIVPLGSKVGHQWSSYDLIATLASGEGTLGLIAETTIKLFQVPSRRIVGIALFSTFEGAVQACNSLCDAGLNPESLMLEDTLRFTLESIGPFISLRDPIVKELKLDSVEAVLIYSYGGFAEVIESCGRHTREIITANRGKLVENKQVVDTYWKAKTELPSWSKDIGKLKVHSFTPAIPLAKAPDFNRKYEELTNDPKLERIGARYYIILPYLECTISPTLMFNENDPEAVMAYDEFTCKYVKEVLKMEGSPVSTLGVGMRLVDVIESTTDMAQVQFMKHVKRGLDPTNLFNPGKKIRI
ncbi:MAG TPA: FAD-binding oxidoreductase [Candidatus Bathyarchaeia archaeon]|nr:FAD-binding oxidoreductase [Candidatus Bathyarchaeia archaeon]